MALSNDLISQFVEITQDEKQTNKESTAYGKIVKQGDVEYVKLDGSDLLTPITSTTVVKDGDRVMVTIRNHEAIVTGDFTNPSANDKDVKEIGGKISEFEIIIADKVSVKQLEAEVAKIDKLIADSITATNAKFETIEGKVAEIDTIKADVVEVEKKITAHEGEFTTIRGEIAEFEDVTAERVDVIDGNFHNLESDYATFKQTTTNKITANEGAIAELDTKKLDAESATITYANIDFSNIKEAAIEKLFSDSGIIKDLIMKDGNVTGELVGVTIKGDLIEGNTVKADKLVILGEDGIYYKLNVDALGEATASSDEKYQNGLDGSVIIAKSITADRVAVTDLVAFGATIGGYHITDHALYSGVKNSASNTTRGIFLGDDGQMAVGDANNYLKFFKDSNGQYKLEIQASAIKLGASSKSVEEVINDTVNNAVDNIQVGGRNYILKSDETYTIYIDTTKQNYNIKILDISPVLKEIDPSIKTFTISYDAYSEKGGAALQGYLRKSDSTAAMSTSPNLGFSTTSWARYSRVAKINDGYTVADIVNFYVRVQAGSDESDRVYIKNIKVEAGNKATDWTPAPEDTDTKIQSVETKADSAQSTANNAQSTANNAQSTANNAQSDINNLEIGGRNYISHGRGNTLEGYFENFHSIVDEDYAQVTISATKNTTASGYNSVVLTNGFLLKPRDYEVGKQVTYSYDIMITQWDIDEGAQLGEWWIGQRYTTAEDSTITEGRWSSVTNHGLPKVGVDCELNEWIHVSKVFTIPEQPHEEIRFQEVIQLQNKTENTSITITVCMKNVKIEYGNKETDWTPAPEDIDGSIENVQTDANEAMKAADDANTAITKAQASIDLLSGMIANLVTSEEIVLDENGDPVLDEDGNPVTVRNTLMTQTEHGWTFNMTSINNNLKAIQSAMENMDTDHSTTYDALEKLTNLVNEIDKKTAYINIGTDDKGNPCIELGKSDNDFKVRITNEAIDFLEGSTKIAYANNNTFYAEKMIVKNELQIGAGPGFVWRTRANGNMGLVYISG